MNSVANSIPTSSKIIRIILMITLIIIVTITLTIIIIMNYTSSIILHQVVKK